MSRSYKKHPVCKGNVKGMKEMANRSVRRKNMEIPSGNAYKKYFDSWDIADYVSVFSFEEYKKRYEEFQKWRDFHGFARKEKSEKDLYRDWKKAYHTK